MNVVKEGKREWVKRGSYIPLGEPRLWKRDVSESGKLFFRCHSNDGRLSILVLCQRAFTIHIYISLIALPLSLISIPHVNHRRGLVQYCTALEEHCAVCYARRRSVTSTAYTVLFMPVARR